MSSRAITIICAVDFSEFAPSAIEHAFSEAHLYTNVALHFITVLEGTGVLGRSQPTVAELEETDTKLRSLVEETLPAFADDRGSPATRILRFHTRSGKPNEEIVELAFEARADRIIVGRHGALTRRGKMGSIAVRVVEAAPCTVHVVQLANYNRDQDEFPQCASCVELRESSGGASWFCPEHSEGRSPRLMRSIGITTPISGWGMF